MPAGAKPRQCYEGAAILGALNHVARTVAVACWNRWPLPASLAATTVYVKRGCSLGGFAGAGSLATVAPSRLSSMGDQRPSEPQTEVRFLGPAPPLCRQDQNRSPSPSGASVIAHASHASHSAGSRITTMRSSSSWVRRSIRRARCSADVGASDERRQAGRVHVMRHFVAVPLHTEEREHAIHAIHAGDGSIVRAHDSPP